LTSGIALQVIELAEHAKQKFASDNFKEQLLGLEQVFELLSLRANLHGITEQLIDAIVDLINPARCVPEVVSGASLVCWKLCEVRDSAGPRVFHPHDPTHAIVTPHAHTDRGVRWGKRAA
jgi:hypothetical protein